MESPDTTKLPVRLAVALLKDRSGEIKLDLHVTDDDLRLLAQRRAQTVKDALVASKQVEPERVFLLEPKALVPEKKEKQRDSRVEFVLK
ncbi:MAG: hypothetical protein WBX49_05755 [Candidatus Deferrimicrobiaceae bacterium]